MALCLAIGLLISPFVRLVLVALLMIDLVVVASYSIRDVQIGHRHEC